MPPPPFPHEATTLDVGAAAAIPPEATPTLFPRFFLTTFLGAIIGPPDRPPINADPPIIVNAMGNADDDDKEDNDVVGPLPLNCDSRSAG